MVWLTVPKEEMKERVCNAALIEYLCEVEFFMKTEYLKW